MSEKLFHIANAIYHNTLPPMNIWVMLPTGIIMGKLTSHDEMTKDIRENIKVQEKENPVEHAVKSVSYQFTYKEMTEQYPGAENETVITLIDAKVLVNELELQAPFANIDADQIIAWGPA